MKPKRNKPTKYRNYDGWPELKKRLEKEIELHESFVPDEESDYTVEEALDSLECCELSWPRYLPKVQEMQDIYDILFRAYPIIKTKISKAVFPSWLITHSVDELKQIINYKE